MGTTRHTTIAAAALLGLSACGGGGGQSGSDGASPDNAITWNGSSNGTVVLDSRNQRFAVRASDGAILDIAKGSYLAGSRVDDQARFVYAGTVIGGVIAAPGTNSSTVAVFGCATGGAMTIDDSPGGWSYTCPPQVQPAPGMTTTVGADPSLAFVTWQGSSNGSYVLDANGETFQVESASRALYDADTGTLFNNVVVDGNGTVSIGGALAGTVQLRPAQGGGQIAVLVCTNGEPLDIVLAPGGGTFNCGAGAPTPVPTTAPETGAEASGLPFTQHGEYITTTTPNRFRVTVGNPNGFAVYCSVFGSYQYPDGHGGLSADSRTNNLTVGAGSSNSTDFGLLESNLSMTSYRTSCQRA